MDERPIKRDSFIDSIFWVVWFKCLIEISLINFWCSWKVRAIYLWCNQVSMAWHCAINHHKWFNFFNSSEHFGICRGLGWKASSRMLQLPRWFTEDAAQGMSTHDVTWVPLFVDFHSFQNPVCTTYNYLWNAYTLDSMWILIFIGNLILNASFSIVVNFSKKDTFGNQINSPFISTYHHL